LISVFAAIFAAFVSLQGQGDSNQYFCKHSVHVHTIWYCPGFLPSAPGSPKSEAM
jgi:hypothetical protein